jgi:hypothetical protein
MMMMKKTWIGAGVVLAALWVQATLITLDSESDFTSNFNIIDSAAAGTVAYSMTAGVGGAAGRVNVSVPTTSGKGIYTSTSIDPDDGTISASFYFLASAYTDNTASRIALGLSVASKRLSDNAEVQARLIKTNAVNGATLEIRSAQTGSTNTTGIHLVDNKWYKFSVVFAVTGGSSFQVNATLEDYGTDGTAFIGSVGTASGVRTSPTDFISGSDRLPVYIGILAQDSGGGAKALDNIDVPTAIPEPASLSLIMISAAGLFFARHHIRK